MMSFNLHTTLQPLAITDLSNRQILNLTQTEDNLDDDSDLDLTDLQTLEGTSFKTWMRWRTA